MRVLSRLEARLAEANPLKVTDARDTITESDRQLDILVLWLEIVPVLLVPTLVAYAALDGQHTVRGNTTAGVLMVLPAAALVKVFWQIVSYGRALYAEQHGRIHIVRWAPTTRRPAAGGTPAAAPPTSRPEQAPHPSRWGAEVSAIQQMSDAEKERYLRRELRRFRRGRWLTLAIIIGSVIGVYLMRLYYVHHG